MTLFFFFKIFFFLIFLDCLFLFFVVAFFNLCKHDGDENSSPGSPRHTCGSGLRLKHALDKMTGVACFLSLPRPPPPVAPKIRLLRKTKLN